MSASKRKLRGTVTRENLYDAVYKKTGCSRTESMALVALFFYEITDCLERGETVKLASFGSFVVRQKGQRVGRNPKTGKEAPITPRRVVMFKPSAILKQRIKSKPARPDDQPSPALPTHADEVNK
jgi:integration host factor subunit alpha